MLIQKLSELKHDLAHGKSGTVTNTFVKFLIEILSLLSG